jgi:alkylhydroperoxidase family enzyme
VLAFASECVDGPDVAEPTFAAAHAVLTDRQLATVIVLVGHYMTVARLTGILQVELDESPDDWAHEH